MTKAYQSAGVDIDAGDRLVKAIGPLALATARKGADASLGGFGGIFDLKAAGFKDPLLVSGADGVGTKLKIAFAMDRHDTIGIDLVAMCANDVLAHGAEPLFFLDYFATGRLREGVAADVVAGVAAGCKLAGCALIGGETAEMPGMYADGEYDVAGFCVGAVERDAMLPGEVASGDILIGISSSGPHSNGYSLIRKIIADAGLKYDSKAPFDENLMIGDALLEPTKIYAQALLPLMGDNRIVAFAHITGGGLTDNIPRVLPVGLAMALDDQSLELPPVFAWLMDAGKITLSDMHRTFNCGIGGCVVTRPGNADHVINALNEAGETARVIGEIKKA